MDYRFRAEQDWDARKSDGTYREDRSRLRYRVRTGVSYKEKYYSIGFRIRTGDQNKQQDPQLTLGKGLKEFGTLPIGFEKAYFAFHKNDYEFWLGKNTYPFEKNNELFWSDNVYPEGVAFRKKFDLKSGLVKSIGFTGGHFILESNDSSFVNDAYFQGLQSSITFRNEAVVLFPSLYVFRNVALIPDFPSSDLLDYTIAHFGSRFFISKRSNFALDLDLYYNFHDYGGAAEPPNLKDQKVGFTAGLKYGRLKTKKDWMTTLTYAYLSRWSILDYMAQNDWARWDYSGFGSPDGRLSNMQGVEAVLAYAINQRVKLVTKYYYVYQIKPFGDFNETGQRIRFDIDVSF